MTSEKMIHALPCVYRVIDARRKFGEHERSVRVAHARGTAERTLAS